MSSTEESNQSSMSPKQEEEEFHDVKDASIKSEDEASPTAAADATHKQAAKRRTKTGCLSKFALPDTLADCNNTDHGFY